MKYITSFVTKIVETRPKAELGLLVHVHENYQAKQKTKEQWLIPCWVPRVWSESGPVFKVCVLPWFLTQSKSSPTEGLLQLHKSVSKSQVPAMFEDRLISYILRTQIFDLNKKSIIWGWGFLWFFVVAAFCYRLITRLHFSQTWTTCSSTEWHVVNCYVSSKVSPPDSFKDHLNNQKHCTV